LLHPVVNQPWPEETTNSHEFTRINTNQHESTRINTNENDEKPNAKK
jgi:hypothetical protein